MYVTQENLNIIIYIKPSAWNNVQQLAILPLCTSWQIVWLVIRIIQNKNSNLTATLIISQEQSWPSGLLLYLISNKWLQCWFSRQNSQFPGQILFYPDVSAGHFQNLFWALTKRYEKQSEIQQPNIIIWFYTCARAEELPLMVWHQIWLLSYMYMELNVPCGWLNYST